ncbi:rhamnulokinase [Bacillus swezeyi]|uniref:Rhamnulokinase n=1 Tax=Bacillus swezeyi TaxID=1925020 RepID=A0A1R1QXL8_9BACI|nr:rhamnulokinase [Bacillus swezeyi]MEC1262971.1 rhamnulokinase [Bacillus swezeyi]MED2929998.1 rhamnulokinase [Bacillus swezeyi]MED2963111.1 rhamnulokinase [Bacillus swezeyi]MED3074319.1 rhamnulokinase [Bacillus swezeyi]MED3084514.1 rhamnulokinase [Bacillus swezeyi]
MSKYSIAVDIGASSGRLMAGKMEEDRLILQEIHRFENKISKNGVFFCWDIQKIFHEIKAGIKKCRKAGIDPVSIGINTWAVDFVLLDENDELLTDAVSYRDPRTDGMMEEALQIVSKEKLYFETGIQFQKFNTIYQLYYLKKNHPEILDKAKSFLMIPDYLNFLLTGVKANEYTNATSTQLVNAFTKQWYKELMEQLGINPSMFHEIKPPKTKLGPLRKELADEFGFDMEVILPATHDTGSAVLSVPSADETIYLSSGTWSLIGVENRFPICVPKAMDYNFTNEGGIDYRFRFLKNIMGLWIIQEVKRNYHDHYSFADFVDLAHEASHFTSKVEVDDQRFLNPENMVEEIRKYCAETDQVPPSTPGEVAKCVFDSLVDRYKQAIRQIEEIFEKEFSTINVIGGGCQNEMLNQLIADSTGKEVLAGPVEATAIGNIVSQLLSLEELDSIDQARNLIRRSFPIKQYVKVSA